MGKAVMVMLGGISMTNRTVSMKNIKQLYVLVTLLGLTACGGGDDSAGNTGFTPNLLDPRVMLNREIYHFEHGEDPVGYTALWCDTLYFEPDIPGIETQGIVYKNIRVLANTTTCSDLTRDTSTQVGTYQIMADNVMVVSFTNFPTVWHMRAIGAFGTYYHVAIEEINTQTSLSTYEATRFYISKIAIETALTSATGQFNEESVEMIIAPPDVFEPNEVIDMDVIIDGMTCAQVQSTYDLAGGYSLTGPALNIRRVQLFDSANVIPPYCGIDFDFLPGDGYSASNFVSGTRYYFVAKPINSMYDESIMISATVP